MSFTRRVKRSLALTATGALALGLMPAGAAMADTDVCDNAPDAGFSDAAGQTHTDEINCIVAYEIAQGLTADLFGTTEFLRRDQAATLFVNFALVATDGGIAAAIDGDKDVPFTDISASVHQENIEILYQLDLIKGTTDTTYSPRTFINRDQFATILYNAHVALDVPFDDSYDDAFGDTGNSVHEDAINALAGEGIISGTTATTFSPTANVRRGQTATLLVNSARVLDALGLWDADRLPGPSVELYSITDGFAVTTAPATDFVWASDGESVSAFEATAGSSFVVDGTASTRAAFNQNLTVADELVVTEDGNNFVFELTNVDATEILSGVIELSLDAEDGDAFSFIDPASGVALNTVPDAVAFGQTYTVDGTTASETRFGNNLSTGDVLVAEVLETNAAGDPTAFRHNLTNAAIDGEIVDAAEAPAEDGDNVLLDTNPDDVYSPELDDDFASPAFAGVQVEIDADDNNVFIVDGEEVDFSDDTDGFDVTVVEGALLTYSRAAGVATYSLTTVDPEPIEAITGVVLFGNDNENGVVQNLDGILLLVDVDEELVEISVAETVNVVIDGLASTRGELLSNISVGDTVTYQEADANYNVAESVNLTNGTITNSRIIGKDAEATSLLVQLANGYEIPNVNPLSNPFGVVGEVDFTINGAAEFTDSDGNTVDAADIALDVLVRTNLVTNNVRLSLDEGDATEFTWQITGIPASVITAAVNA